MSPHFLMPYFSYTHLPPHLQDRSKPFWDLATQLDATLPDGDQKTEALRALLVSKDCAVRAALPVRRETTDGR